MSNLRFIVLGLALLGAAPTHALAADEGVAEAEAGRIEVDLNRLKPADGAAHDDCLGLIEPTARGPVPFIE